MSASDENIQQNPEQNSENTDLSRIASQSRISHYTDTGYKGETYTVRYRNKMYQNNNNLTASSEEVFRHARTDSDVQDNSLDANTDVQESNEKKLKTVPGPVKSNVRKSLNRNFQENIITPRNPRNASRERTRSFKNLDDQLVTISAAPSALINHPNLINVTNSNISSTHRVISNQPSALPPPTPPPRPPPPRPPPPQISNSFNSNQTLSEQLVLSENQREIVLQATVEFSFELRELYNIDLFEKGHYHVRISVLESNHLSNDTPPLSLQEVHDNLNVADEFNSENLKPGPNAKIHGQNSQVTGQNSYYGQSSQNNWSAATNSNSSINSQTQSSSSSLFFTKSSETNTHQTQQHSNQNNNNTNPLTSFNNPLNRFQSEVIPVRPPQSTVIQPKRQTKLRSEKSLQKNNTAASSKNNKHNTNSTNYEFTSSKTSLSKSEDKVRCPTAVSDVCQINYKRESVPLEQIYLFRVHKLIDCKEIDEQLSNWDVPFLFELWWEEDDLGRGENKNQGPQRVSQRIVNVNWNSKTGTHDYGIAVFEYGYAAALEFVVHGSLTALHQPYKSIINELTGSNFPVPTLEDILFTGLAGRAGEWESIKDMDITQVISTANSAQAKIINHLNVAYEVLAPYLSKKPDRLAMNFKEKIDSVSLCETVQEAIAQINMNMAQVCSLLLERWTIVQDELAMSEKHYNNMKENYHKNKITRYQQGHFLLKSSIDKPIRSNDESMMFDREAIFSKMATFLRESKYFKNIKPLAIRCQEMDLSNNLHVILIEDRYYRESQPNSIEQSPVNQPKHNSDRKSSTVSENQINIDMQPKQTEFRNKQLIRPKLVHQESHASINSTAMANSDHKLALNSMLNAATEDCLDSSLSCLPTGQLQSLYLIPGESHHAKKSPQVSLLKIKKLSEPDLRIESETAKNFEWRSENEESSDGEPTRNCRSALEKDENLGKHVDGLTSAFCMPRMHMFKNIRNNSAVSIGNHFQNPPKFNKKLPFARWALANEVNPVSVPAKGKTWPAKLALPYFPYREAHVSDPVHLVVCVHGLEGSSSDLRLFRSWVERTTLNHKMRICWLMASSNTDDTFADINIQGERLADEICEHINILKIQRRNPGRLSFIGHSMGTLVAKVAAASDKLKQFRDIFYTYLSLNGPHLGLKYNTSKTHSVGLWLLQKFKKSQSLQQLQLNDAAKSSPNLPFIYKLLRQPAFMFFKNAVFVSCAGDKYVPFHSARIELSKDASEDKSAMGKIHRESIQLVKKRIKESDKKTRLYRFHVNHVPNGTPGNGIIESTLINLTGRAPHILTVGGVLRNFEKNGYFLQKW